MIRRSRKNVLPRPRPDQRAARRKITSWASDSFAVGTEIVRLKIAIDFRNLIFFNPLIMQFHPNEIFLVYNPETSKGRQTKALARSINSHVNELNIICEKLGPTYWKEVVTMLGLDPKEILDRAHPDYQEKIAGNTFTMNGYLEVLMHYPHLVKAPIAIYNGKAVLCQTPTDIYKLGVSPQENAERVLPHLRKTF